MTVLHLEDASRTTLRVRGKATTLTGFKRLARRAKAGVRFQMENTAPDGHVWRTAGTIPGMNLLPLLETL